MASKRKRHLQYQAKKGRLQSSPDSEATETTPENKLQDKHVVTKKTKNDVNKSTKNLVETTEISRLPESETTYVKKELVYLLLVALLLAAIYLAIWLLFKYTGIDESLYSFIKLGGR